MKNSLPHCFKNTFAPFVHGFLDKGILDHADLSIIDTIAHRFEESRPDVLFALALILRAPRAGHVGAVLIRLPDILNDDGRMASEEETKLQWPNDLKEWENRILDSNAVGGPDTRERPFVCQKITDLESPMSLNLLMTRRMWREQERLALVIKRMSSCSPALQLSSALVENGISRLFNNPDNQGARAVRAAAEASLIVVTGGPGTGKTYSIKRLLALLFEANAGAGQPLRVLLAAPTGKAAVRMKEAIAEELDNLDTSTEVCHELVSLVPQTLHKLIGIRPNGTTRHNSENPLKADVVVVDEASMVDLMNMRRLFEAIPEGARLLLLGDRDQLASVEAGSVLADIVSPVLDGKPLLHAGLKSAVVHFDKNHRFANAPTIAAIAAGLQRRDDLEVSAAVAMMKGTEVAANETIPNRIRHLGVPVGGRPDEEKHLVPLAKPFLSESGFVGKIVAAVRKSGLNGQLQDPLFHVELLETLENYRVLAVHRRGPLGVSGLQQWLIKHCRSAIENALREYKNTCENDTVRLTRKLGFVIGTPILVTENNYDVGLMNGDIGLVLPTKNGLSAVFPILQDGSLQAKEVALARLPATTEAYCMTVHKSQGSQFDRVALVLAGRNSPIQTRELIYTAITRSKNLLDWLGSPDELQSALLRRVTRASGLSDLLWSPERPVGN